MSPPAQMPPSARAIRETVTEAAAAAAMADPQGYRRACSRLTDLDPERVRLVLGSVVRLLLEDLYPAGLDGDALAETLSGCVRGAAPWWPAIEPNTLVVLLAGALGTHQLDEGQASISPAEMASSAPLLVADLLARCRQPLDGYLATAFAEIARAETVELP